jgi:hypothetical protein
MAGAIAGAFVGMSAALAHQAGTQEIQIAKTNRRMTEPPKTLQALAFFLARKPAGWLSTTGFGTMLQFSNANRPFLLPKLLSAPRSGAKAAAC